MSDPIVWLHDAQPDAEYAAYVVCAKGDPGCFPVFAGPQERGHGATTGSHHNTSTSVKALDLSHALQYALLAGQKGIEWVNFDPTSNPAYQRITECLERTPGEEDVSTKCENLNTSAEYVIRDDMDEEIWLTYEGIKSEVDYEYSSKFDATEANKQWAVARRMFIAGQRYARVEVERDDE